MKRWIIKFCFAFTVLCVVVAVALPLTAYVVKRRVVSELGYFIREGSVSVKKVSGSLRRREIRLRDVTIYDADMFPAISIPKIDIVVTRLHQHHVDATLRLFDPVINLDFRRPENILRLLRTEAFQKEGRLEIEKVDLTGGSVHISAPGILLSPETLAIRSDVSLAADTNGIVDLRAVGPRTELLLKLHMDARHDANRILAGTYFEVLTSNLVLIPRLHLKLAPADSVVSSLDGLRLNVAFLWGPLLGQFSRIRQSQDSPGIFLMDEMRLSMGSDGLSCRENRIDVRSDTLRLESAQWTRIKTGSKLDRVNLLAGRHSSQFEAEWAGHPLKFRSTWEYASRPRIVFEAAALPVGMLLLEIGGSWPVDGVANVHLDLTQTDTPPRQISWNAAVGSSDLRIGPAFGKISCRAQLSVSGAGLLIHGLSGVVEPAFGAPVVLSGKGDTSGFVGHASMQNSPLRDIRLVGEAFGRKFPLVGETGGIGLDVDFSVKSNLELSLRGRLRIKNATAGSKKFPFRLEGLDADIPLEYTPDSGKLVMAEAVVGAASAKVLTIGPYRFEKLNVKTASQGDKIYTDFSPISAFGGKFQAKLLFHFSKESHQHAEVAVDSVSLTQILAPFPKAHQAISGLIDGEARMFTRGGDWMSAKGTLQARAVEGRGEPMRVSRGFLEQLGGSVVRKLDLPERIPYKDGLLKVRMSDGRIWFDEVSLEAHTMVRKIRIGKVVGSYKLKDLIDVLSNVSTQNVKVEVGGKQRK